MAKSILSGKGLRGEKNGSYKHGMYGHPDRHLWQQMKQRCRCVTNSAYASYGGRGIKFCERWDNFLNFVADMGPRPSPQHSIDRINNDGNYEPGNCRWATRKEQANNRRSSRRLTHAGRNLTLAQWADELGMDWRVFHKRLSRGWSEEDAISRSLRKVRKWKYGPSGSLPLVSDLQSGTKPPSPPV